jgi:hypothetical protein
MHLEYAYVILKLFGNSKRLPVNLFIINMSDLKVLV